MFAAPSQPLPPNDIASFTADDALSWPTTTSSRYPNHGLPVSPVFLHLIECSLCILLIVGNTTVIWIIKNNDNLRNKANAFVATLAISDLCFGICVFARTLRTTWYSTSFGCQLIGAINTFFPSTANITLCFVGIDRLLFVRKPARYQETCRFSKNAIGLAYIVTHAVCFATLPPVWGWGKFTPYGEMKTCLLDLSGSPAYGYATLLYGFIFPFIVLVLVYFRIYRAARLLSIRVRSESFAKGHNRGVVRHTRHGFRRTSKTLSLMIILHFLCWTPFVVVQLTGLTLSKDVGTDNWTNDALYASWLPILANSAIAPWVYGLYNPAFRRCIRFAFATVYCRRIRRRRIFRRRFRVYQVSPYI